MRYKLRLATLQDRAILETLIARSARQLGAQDYTSAQIDAALRGALSVDTQLILDGSYFVVTICINIGIEDRICADVQNISR